MAFLCTAQFASKTPMFLESRALALIPALSSLMFALTEITQYNLHLVTEIKQESRSSRV